MTREQIAQKVNELAHELITLGNECAVQHYQDPPGEYSGMLYLLGESCRNFGWTLESFNIYIKPRG